MGSWHVNEGLQPLINAVKSKYPGVTVYTIGDTAHQAEKSDHNPNQYGRVNAADIMLKDGVFTHLNAVALTKWLILDERTKYTIYNRRIWENGSWRDYHGSDPHTNHVHQSVFDSAHADTSSWVIDAPPVKESILKIYVELPIIGQGADDSKRDGYDLVRRIQRAAGMTGADVDGMWGNKTTVTLGYSSMNEERYRNLFGLSK